VKSEGGRVLVDLPKLTRATDIITHKADQHRGGNNATTTLSKVIQSGGFSGTQATVPRKNRLCFSTAERRRSSPCPSSARSTISIQIITRTSTAASTSSEEATDLYEGARSRLAKFIGAPSERGLIFTAGRRSRSICLAYRLARDEARRRSLGTIMEHHSNQVPWQLLSPAAHGPEARGRHDEGILEMGDYDSWSPTARRS